MSEDLLRRIAMDLNEVPGSAERASRSAPLVIANNARIAAEAIDKMAFDSLPYAYQAWLVAADKR